MAAPSILQEFDASPNVEVARHQDVVCSLDHVLEPYSPSQTVSTSAVGDESQPSAVDVAHGYLLEVADAYGIPKSFLKNDNSQLAAEEGLSDSPPALKLVGERSRFISTTVSYQQTLLGLPVWGAEVSITLNGNQKVINSVSSVRPHATEPREPKDDAKYLKDIGVEGLRAVLALRPGDGQITINQQKLLVYQYRKDNRQQLAGEQQPHEEGHHVPTLILNAVPDSIQDGRYYVVREVLFSLPLPGYGALNWRAFIEVETGVVLYLRALTAGFTNLANGSLFTVDPITRKGSSAPLPTGKIDELNLLRQKISLSDITPTSPQALRGAYAEIKDSNPPRIVIPTSSNGEFDGDVESDVFAAVNAYHHITSLFGLVNRLGFSVSKLFDRTALPVPVDHRALNDEVNAQAPGNATGDGSGGFLFGRAAQNSKIGIAADFRVAAHEFGHALLWNAVKSPNFGFAHSPGDSLAAIFCDPGSQAPSRFETFPWITISRNHGREVADGWAWGGPEFINDAFGAGYRREQILSTSLFRLYRAIGGDALGNIQKQTWASRYTLYLILAGIASLTSKSPIPNPYVTLMINADNGKILGFPGGAARKVIRWAFEKQGLYQPVPAPSPVKTRGAPPAVDVYINDSRNGEYDYLASFDNAPGIWNRQKNDGVQVNQTPVLGATNYVYVTVQNRGTQPAQGIQVKAYVSKVEKAQKWDAEHTEFDELTLVTPINTSTIASGGSLNVGPFKWTPDRKYTKHTLLVSVSAQGDLSNIDPNSGLDCAKGPTDLENLVPFDNNLAIRTV